MKKKHTVMWFQVLALILAGLEALEQVTLPLIFLSIKWGIKLVLLIILISTSEFWKNQINRYM